MSSSKEKFEDKRCNEPAKWCINIIYIRSSKSSKNIADKLKKMKEYIEEQGLRISYESLIREQGWRINYISNSAEQLLQSNLYEGENIKLNDLSKTKAIIEFLDTAEEESSLIAIREKDLNKSMELFEKGEKGKQYTHIEIHPSLIFGVMGNQIVFPENNQLPRDLFSCGQSKQGVSLYHSNYQNRIDKMGVISNYGQIPLIVSEQRYSTMQHTTSINIIIHKNGQPTQNK